MRLIPNLLKDDSGATAIEYGLIASLVSVAAIVAFISVGSSTKELFCSVDNTVAAAADTAQTPGKSGAAPGQNKC